ncbi:Regulator of Vps4 activity in the MVB pathway protein [Euphorbia peplus]|nr:Regulator of Vps4 activity in the MVB pathway protein [Euphorbia peplus]
MLEGILGRGYSAKCKSLIKLTKSRIEVVRRKRNATLRFLKRDMADLLAKGLDINAYGRAEGLLAELILSSCYDYVENSCDFVVKHLSVMQKIRHCPEDCREAVSSLMFAAARFSDLPELRELRDIFLERYGTSLELFANQEFVQNLSSAAITTEKKVQLMRDIASEFSISWDSKGFEQRASRPSPFMQEQPKVQVSSYDNENRSMKGKDTVLRSNFDASPKGRLEIANDGYRLQSEKERNGLKRNELNSQSRYEVPSNGYSPLNAREEPPPKGRLEIANDGYRLQSEKERNGLKRNELNSQSRYEVPNNGYSPLNAREEPALKGRLEIANDGYRLQSEKERNGLKRNELNSQSRYEVPSNGYSPLNAREEPPLKPRDARDAFSQGRKEVLVDRHEPWKTETPSKKVSSSSSSHRTRTEVGGGSTQSDDRENTAPKRDSQDPLSRGKPDILSNRGGPWSKNDGKDSVAVNHDHVGQYNAVNSARDAQEEAHKLNLYLNNAMPPPYTKPNGKLKEGKYGGSLGSSDTGSDSRSEKKLQEVYRAESERQSETPATARANGDGQEIDNAHQEIGVSNKIPKPRSSRRRPSRSRSSRDDVGLPNETAGVAKRRSRSRRRDDSRKGLQILFDDEHDEKDEEERMIDKLLIHYSKKSSAYEPGTVRRKPRSRQPHDPRTVMDDISRNEPDEISEMVPPPRSVSLPREQTASSESTAKVFSRAASFQPDRSSAAKHVHPKLPDYDDLAARFAALKGR